MVNNSVGPHLEVGHILCEHKEQVIGHAADLENACPTTGLFWDAWDAAHLANVGSPICHVGSPALGPFVWSGNFRLRSIAEWRLWLCEVWSLPCATVLLEGFWKMRHKSQRWRIVKVYTWSVGVSVSRWTMDLERLRETMMSHGLRFSLEVAA